MIFKCMRNQTSKTCENLRFAGVFSEIRDLKKGLGAAQQSVHSKKNTIGIDKDDRNYSERRRGDQNDVPPINNSIVLELSEMPGTAKNWAFLREMNI